MNRQVEKSGRGKVEKPPAPNAHLPSNQRVMKKVNLDEELREISPFLHDLKKRDGAGNGFRVPEGYFANMEDEVFATLDAIGARRKTAPVPSFGQRLADWLAGFWRPRLALAFAGMLAVALSAWWFLRPNPADAPAQFATVEISEEEAETFVLAHVGDFEPHQLAPDGPEDLPNPIKESLEKNNSLRPEDVEHLLDDLTDAELEELL